MIKIKLRLIYICVSIAVLFLGACIPQNMIGEPQVSCLSNGMVRIAFPIAPVVYGVDSHPDGTVDIIPGERDLKLGFRSQPGYAVYDFNPEDLEFSTNSEVFLAVEIEYDVQVYQTSVVEDSESNSTYTKDILEIQQKRYASANYNATLPECNSNEEIIGPEDEPKRFPYILPVIEPPVDEAYLPPTPTPNPDGVPVILNSTCVGSGEFKQLMVVFQFEQDVTGEYAALVADIPYQLTPVIDYPNRLYYFGTPPPQGPITIRLVSTDDLSIVLEETYTPVVCGAQERPKDDDDDDDYHPPS